MKRSRLRGLGLIAMMAGASCTTPDDAVFSPPVVEPVAEGPRFRVTFNPGPDVARAFRADGRLLYWSAELPPFGNIPAILSVPPAGGVVREEAGIYRAGLRDEVRQLIYDARGRVLVTWRRSVRGVHGCNLPAPAAPTAVALGIHRLDPADGRALSSLPKRSIDLPVITGAGTNNQRVRITPAEVEIRARGVDPYGPTVGPEGDAIVSDGETLWRIDLEAPQSPPVPLGPGAFPSLSPDGRRLAAAVPMGRDSVTRTDIIPGTLEPCVQETVFVQARWEVVVIDLGSDAVTTLGPGLEPRFDASGSRLLVRRDALYWVPIDGGAPTAIMGTIGGFAGAPSPDGQTIAFSLGSAPNHDVYLVRGEE